MRSFEGKKILVLGVANERSIAYGVARHLKAEGAEVALTYAGDAMEKRVRPLASDLGVSLVLPCDVQSDSQLDNLFAHLKGHWGTLDGLVHSIAFADREDLMGRFCETSRSGFRTAMEVSVFSLIALAGRAQGLMRDRGGSILTFTYLGSQRVVDNYKIMGVAKAGLEASVRYLAAELGENRIRVNGISAGPLKTLAASGIPQFRDLYSQFEEKAPLRRNVKLEDVASSAAYFLSDASSAVTGEIQFVDCGFNILGV